MTNELLLKIKKMMNLEESFIIFGRMTRMPFIICDEETFNDQVWIFSTKDAALSFCDKRQKENKDILMVVKMEKKQNLMYFGNLFILGVNEVVLYDEDTATPVALTEIMPKPDFSSLPVTNPQMNLTGLYFMQEVYRAIPNNEKQSLKELEEEMEVNLVRSKFLVPLVVDGEKILPDRTNVKIPCLLNKEKKKFIPIFTDFAEFQKFDQKKQLQMNVIEFKKIMPMLNNDIEGVIVNPMGMNIQLIKSIIPSIIEKFKDN